MAIDKRVATPAAALEGVGDGATVLISGFGGAGFPNVMVAALENAAMEFEDDEEGGAEQGQDMTFILSELRNLDHQHWSSLLAEYIQEELARVFGDYLRGGSGGGPAHAEPPVSDQIDPFDVWG